MDLFMPDRGTTAAMTGGQTINSESNSFLIPEFGYNKQLDGKYSYGVSVYGNGGMNTDYATNPVGGSGRMGVDLMQLVIAPTLAYKLDSVSSVGITPLITYQQIKVNGISHFGQLSVLQGDSLSNQGYSRSHGVGVRLGYFRQLNSDLALGASYSPKTKMSQFKDYAGLFAGDFDIPENYTLGVSYQAKPGVKISADYQRINYGDVAAIGNPTANLSRCMGGDMTSCLGGANGPGFGWKSVDVIKLGVEWKYSPVLVLRAGYNHSTNPVTSADVTFNIMAPGVTTTHYTLGGTYDVSKETEVTLAYMYAPENSVKGNGLFNGIPGYTPVGATDTVRMSQQSLGIQFGWKF